MTKREFAALICRVMGIYFIVSSVRFLPKYFEWILLSISSSGPSSPIGIVPISWQSTIVHGLPVSLNICCGLVLCFQADHLAHWMVKDDTTAMQPFAFDREAEIIAFRLLGMIVIIPRIGQITARLMQTSHHWVQVAPFETNELSNPEIAGAVAQVLMGFWLLLGAPGLVRFLHSMRTMGMDEDIQTEEE